MASLDVNDLVQFCKKSREVPPLPSVKIVAEKLGTSPLSVIRATEEARARGLELITDADCELLEIQERILEAVVEFNKISGYPPSMEELAAHLGLTNVTVKQHLLDMRWKGHVTWLNNKPRTLRILKRVSGE